MTGLEWFKKSKIIAIVRGLAPEHMVQLAEALYEGGIDLIEVTFHQSQPETWQNTATSIQAIASHMTGRMLVGAGTVICEKQLDMACKAGAAYVVTPNTDSHLIRTVKVRGLLSFPGAFTPSEIVEAYQAGADAVKVFPAGNLGPSYIQAIKAPLPHIPLVAVGGINVKNAREYMAAGCCGIGIGGNLVNKNWIEAGAWNMIAALAREYRKAVETR